MDYEKKYKEALLKARDARQNTESAVTIGILEEIFPEIRELEDEGMKKELIKFLQECHNIDSGFFSRYCEIPFAKMLDWLEKQGATSQRMISAEAKEAMYDKPTWSEEDKDFLYDTLSNLTELKDRYGEGYGNVGKCIDWLKSFKDRIQPQPKQEWSEEDEVKINRIVACLENLNVADNDILLKDVDWLKSLKQRMV